MTDVTLHEIWTWGVAHRDLLGAGFVVFGAVLVLSLLALVFRGRSSRDLDATSSFVLPQRRLILRAFEGDEFGACAERVRGMLAPGLLARLGVDPLPYELVVGDTAQNDRVSGESKTQLGVMLLGKVQGHRLEVRFHSPRPVGSSHFDGGQTGADFAIEPGFDCFDFPLSEFKGMTVGLPGVQRALLHVAVHGTLAQGSGLSGFGLSSACLQKSVARFEAVLPQLRVTQPALYQEMMVVTAWGYLMIGLKNRDEEPLMKALMLYDRINRFDWRQRDAMAWAGIKSNEALTAFVLAHLSRHKNMSIHLSAEETGDFPLSHWEVEGYQRAMCAAQEALRVFHRDRFPSSWGKLVALRGLAGAALFAAPPLTNEFVEFDGHELDARLDEVIGFWEKVPRRAVMFKERCSFDPRGSVLGDAYFAKGVLVKAMAKRDIGLQDWELAETAFLGVLSLGEVSSGWWAHSEFDVHFELGRLYHEWGAYFGDRQTLEKAVHHFDHVLDGGAQVGEKSAVAALNLARCYLSYGGVTNEERPLVEALARFERLKDKACLFDQGAGLDRYIAVCRARLALLQRDCALARRAVSEISAVMGQRVQGFPGKALLLRLRARLRELLFVLEGDASALDIAIVDRRRLVALADEGLSDLRAAVEVGDLVGLLARRQYKVSNRHRDFHEAHYLLEQALARCGGQKSGVQSGLHEAVLHVKARLQLQLGRLLASFARVEHDLSAFHEALAAFEAYLALCSRHSVAVERAEALNDMGQIFLDCSTHYGQHHGLSKAVDCFAEAYDIFLEAGHIDQANRMLRFMDHAQVSLLAYKHEDDDSEVRAREG